MTTTTGKTPRAARAQGLRGWLQRLVLLVAFAFLAFLGFLYWASREGHLAEWVKEELQKELHARCAVDATFSAFTFDPFPPEATMSGLELRHLDGRPLVSIDEAIVSLQVLPLFAQRVQLDRIAVLAPKAAIELRDGQLLDLPKCIAPSADSEPLPVVVGIRELTIERGEFDLVVDQRYAARLHGIGISLAPGARTGGSNLTVGLDDGHFAIDGREVVLSRFRVLAQLEGLLTDPRAILVRQLEAVVGDVTLGVEGSVDLLGPVYEARVDLKAPLAAVAAYVPDLPPLSGQLALTATVSGTAALPNAVGRLELEGVRFAEYTLGDRATIDFHADKEAVDVSRLDLHVADGRIRAKAHLMLDDHLTIRIEKELEDVQLARVLDSVGIIGAWPDFRANGRSTLNGTLLEPTRLEGRFDFAVEDFYVFDRPWDSPPVRDHAAAPPELVLLHPPGRIDVAGTWGFDPLGLDFTDATIATGNTSGVASARIHFDESAPIRVEASLPQADLDDVGPIGGVRFRGRGSIDALVSGSLANIGGTGRLALADVSVEDIPFGEMSGEARWHDDVKLDFTNIRAKLGETTYGGALSVVVEDEVPFDIRGRIDAGRVQDLLVPFRQLPDDWGNPVGKLDGGTFTLSGPITKLTGPVELAFTDLNVLDERFEKGRMMGRLDRGAVVFEDVELTKHGATIFGRGRLDPESGLVRARARTRDLTLQKIDLVALTQPTLDGKLGLELTLGGTLDAVTGTVTAKLTDVRAGPVDLGTGLVDGQVRGRNVALQGAVLGKSLAIDGDVELVTKLPYRASLVLAPYDVPKILSGLQGHTRWTGRAAGKAKLSGSLVDWHLSSGAIELAEGLIDTGSIQLETVGASSFLLKQGVLETQSVQIAGPRTRLVADGRLGANVVDLEIDGTVDLGIAELLSPSIERVGGVLTLDSAVQGTPGDVNLVGTGRVDSGILQWRGFDGRFSGFSADLVFSQSTVLIERGEGRFADGRVSLTGSVLLDGYLVKNLSIVLALEDVRPKMTYPLVELSGLLNGTINADGSLDRLVVRGELDVQNGRAKPKVDITNLGDKSKLAVNVYDPSQETVDMDLGFHLLDPLHIKNDQVDLELKGDLRLTGTNQRFGMLGSTNLVRGGRVALFSREFEMITGIIEFDDRFRFAPRYDLSLNTEACAARISINIVGDLAQKPQATYMSNPEMDEDAIVSCIVRGVKVRDQSDDLAKLASGALFKGLGLDREVKKVLPVDDIEVTSEYSSQTKSYEPRVLLAKELLLFGGPARLEYSSALGKKEDQEIRLRYRISPGLTLQGGWASSRVIQPVVGDLHLDLKYRWEW
ncbi:translocation/assembly module TamB [Myxococcota bacterium]|nr:translocation/assembly module TamB [Myxococcota bacterium]